MVCFLTASVSVWSSICHADDSSCVVFECLVQFVVEVFSIDGLAALARPSRIAALNHELANGTVELCVVVGAARGQRQEILARAGSLRTEELQLQIAQIRVQRDGHGGKGSERGENRRL